MTFGSIQNQIKNYLSKKEQGLTQKAYLFAKTAHKGKKRGTGEPYINHVLAVAYYLAKREMDAPTITAAILHDVEEDSPQLKGKIIKDFGPEVANLVEGVTKLGKIKIKKSWFLPLKILQDRKQKQLGLERHVESLRKMLLAMTKDIRVVMIKFADRLHNMQTLRGVRPEKRERIAHETLEIYAPLAYRLGMGELKGQLEDLAFLYAYPKEYQRVRKLAGDRYEEKEKYIGEIIGDLQNKLKEENIKAEIHGRRKHLYSLFRKLQRCDDDISKIYDIVAVRVVVTNIEECYRVLGIVHAIWRPLIGRIKDYIAMPKPNGYQSLHTTVFGPDGEIVEIQIRTKEMHDRAENGIAAHWHYSGSGAEKHQASRITKEQLGWLKELRHWQESLKNAQELSQALTLDFFRDRIFVFTPQGDVRDLPLNATPVDFAYSVHSEIGEACVGARVNGKLVKLNYPLRNGDIVEIITKKASSPKRDWLRFVKTSRARSKIRSTLEK